MHSRVISISKVYQRILLRKKVKEKEIATSPQNLYVVIKNSLISN